MLFPILSIIIFIPLVAGLVILLMPAGRARLDPRYCPGGGEL